LALGMEVARAGDQLDAVARREVEERQHPLDDRLARRPLLIGAHLGGGHFQKARHRDPPLGAIRPSFYRSAGRNGSRHMHEVAPHVYALAASTMRRVLRPRFPAAPGRAAPVTKSCACWARAAGARAILDSSGSGTHLARAWPEALSHQEVE